MHMFPSMRWPGYKVKEFIDLLKTLNLSAQCNAASQKLGGLVTNPNLLSKQLRAQLIPAATGVPYHLNPDDPEPAASIKKLSNVLYNLEQLFAELEAIELSESVPLSELMATLSILVRSIYRVVNQVYTAVDLINNSSVVVEAFIGPELDKLKKGFNFLHGKFDQMTASAVPIVNKDWGVIAGETVNRLPQEHLSGEKIELHKLSQTLFNLPGYFKQLQNMLNSKSLFPDTKAIDNSSDPSSLKQRLEREKEVAEFTANLDQIAMKTGLGKLTGFAGATANMMKFLSVNIRDLIQTNLSITQTSYEAFENLVFRFKHEILPEALDELEALEEATGFVLAEPALALAETYYQKLMTEIGAKIEQARLKLDDEFLLKSIISFNKGEGTEFNLGSEFKLSDKILSFRDDEILIAKTESRRQTRLKAAEEKLNKAIEIEGVAYLFFNRISSFERFASLSNEEKEELALYYQQIKPDMAAAEPSLDQSIVDFLNLKSEPKEEEPSTGLFAYVPQILKTTAQYSFQQLRKLYPFQSLLGQIAGQRNAVSNLIKKEIASQKMRINSIKDRQVEAKQSPIQTDKALNGQQASLENPSAPIKLESFKAPPKGTVLGRVKDLNLSTQVNNALQDAMAYLKENLTEELVLALRLHSNNPRVLPYTINANEPNQVSLYKNALNAFYYLREGLIAVENAGKHQTTAYTLTRALFLVNSLKMTIGPIKKMRESIKSAGNNPQLTLLLQQLSSSYPQLTTLFNQDQQQVTEKKKAMTTEDAQKEPSLFDQVIAGFQNLPLPETNDPTIIQLKQDKEALIQALQQVVQLLPAFEEDALIPKLRALPTLLKSLKGLKASSDNLAFGGHQLVIENLDDLHRAWTSIVLLVDDVEFSLGLKPPCLFSSLMTQRFDQFYKGFVKSLKSTDPDKAMLTLLSGDAEAVLMRLNHEKKRLEAPNNSQNSTQDIDPALSEQRQKYFQKLLEEKTREKQIYFEAVTFKELKREKYEQIVPLVVGELSAQKTGIYFPLFLKNIKPTFDALSASILKNITDQPNLEEPIKKEVYDLYESVANTEPLKDLKKCYGDLQADYQVIQQIKTQLQALQPKEQSSALIKEIISFETRVQDFISTEALMKEENNLKASSERVKKHAEEIKEFKDKLEISNQLIRLQQQKQKISFINTHEKHSSQFHNQDNKNWIETDCYNALIKVHFINKKLIEILEKDIQKLSANKNPNDQAELNQKNEQLKDAECIHNILAKENAPSQQQRLKVLEGFLDKVIYNNPPNRYDYFSSTINNINSILIKQIKKSNKNYAFFESHPKNNKDKILEKLELLLSKIKNKISSLGTNKVAQAKKNVLGAAGRLIGKLLNNKSAQMDAHLTELDNVIAENPLYKKAPFKSETAELVEETRDLTKAYLEEGREEQDRVGEGARY